MCVLALLASQAGAQEKTESTTETGGDRNVMLNAADTYKPREIQIGLPSEDVNVYENGLPAVYSSSVHKLSAHWRNDASLKGTSLMTPSESAIATGNIAYSVNAQSELGLGSRDFQATLNYHANHYGLQNFDLNLSGKLAPHWYWTASMYQNFDPGTIKLRFTDFADRTQIYHAGITREFNNHRGKISLLYKYSNSKNAGNFDNQGPFIYVGDGSVKKLNGFRLGRDSYVPASGTFTYLDIMDGKQKTWTFNEALENRAHEVALLFDYQFDNGLKWNVDVKYMNAPRANYVDFGGSTIFNATAADGYTTADGTAYEGLAEGRRTWLHFGKVSNLLLTSELHKQVGNHALRLGMNEWYYHLDYHSSSMQWVASADNYPTVLYTTYTNPLDATQSPYRTQTYGYNELSPEYTKGYENKLAVYFTDNWQVTPKFKVLYGGRLEYYRMSADQIAASRFPGFHIGDFETYSTAADGTITATSHSIHADRVVKNKLNYAATLQLTYALNSHLGLLADGTVATRYPRISDYAGTGPTEEQYKRVTIPLLRGGVYFKNSWLDLTSMVSYISKSNNIDQQNLTRPGTTEAKTVLLIYNIRTLGWTTSAEMDPFRNFHLHALFTWQKPVYSNYNASVTFSGGQTMSVDADGMVVKEIPQVLIEFDPSYNITPNLRAWLSFRYFGKTYANLQEALYFNGHWETFGGVNWQVNKHLSLGVDVVNFLNQTGAKGTINGSELISKSEASQYAGTYMSGSYLRPFTVEFSASLHF
ncbi:MAG: TonB-dependent receptor [Prevotella sp.]|nr:TonB-dependent receptor [Prevotella sp.]